MTAGTLWAADGSPDTRSETGQAAYFDVHGVRLEVSSTWPLALEAVRMRLEPFAGSRCIADLRIEIRPDAGEESGPWPSADARTVYDSPSGDVLYSEQDDRLFVRIGPVRATCDPARGMATVLVREDAPSAAWVSSHPTFTLCLSEMLRHRGIFPLHAAALTRDGNGLLIAGTSGAGKSTLALALSMSDFEFLGDDTCFLTSHAGRTRILAFPDEVDVCDETIDFFEELTFLRDRPKRPGASKRHLRAGELRGGAEAGCVLDCAPAVIVFPAVAHAAESTLEKITAAEAMMELVPNVLLTHPRVSREHLRMLDALVRASACYRLATGRDFESLSLRLGALL